MPNIDGLNPYPAWRAGQKEACQAIVEAVQDGQKIITYKGPTGSGKSLVLSVAARALLEEGEIKRATYTTPQRQLVYQLAGDERLGITALLGRANYPCREMPQGNAGDCPVPAKVRRKTCPRCPYLAARDAFVDASVGATTIDKLLTDRSLPSAEMLIVDESQGLEMKLIDQRAAILPEWMDLAGDLPEQMGIWLAAIRAKQLKYEGKLEKLFARMAPPGESEEVKSLMGYVDASDAAKVARTLERINRALDKAQAISRIISETPGSYVIDCKSRTFKLISGREQFREFIMGTQAVILASGTPCTALLADDYVTVCAPHPVDVDRRRVYYDPVGKMNYQEREKTIDIMAERIVELHRKYNRSTLIHCHSYGIADRLGEAIRDLDVRAMWVMPREREQSIERWKAAEDACLMSVACEEGLDLAGEKYPLNVIAKVPFLPYKSDEWTEKRKAADNKLPAERRWENVSVALAIQQAAGRCTRGPGDWSETYILDSSFEWFYKRNYNLFEEWFKDSLCKVVR